jgi:hypothetical protein
VTVVVGEGSGVEGDGLGSWEIWLTVVVGEDLGSSVGGVVLLYTYRTYRISAPRTSASSRMICSSILPSSRIFSICFLDGILPRRSPIS